MRRKKRSLLVLLLTFVLILTGCGAGGQDSDQKSSDKKVKIVFSQGKNNSKYVPDLIRAFEKKHPNIDVEFRVLPSSSTSQHDAYVTALNAKSSEYDVISMDVVWPAEFAQAGYVLPLDRFIQKDRIDMGDYNKGAVLASNFNGKQWAMPRFGDAGVLFYRKDIIPQSEVPKTWDQLQKVAEKYKNKNGLQYGYLMQAKQYEGLVCNAVEFIASYGGEFINRKGEVVINSPEAIKGLQKMVDIAHSNIVPGNVNTFTEVESHTAFVENESPFIRDWAYLYALSNDKTQSKIVGKVGVAPLPAGDKGSVSALGGWQLGISKFSKHPKEAWEFVKFMTGKEGQKMTAIKMGNVPTLTSLFQDKEVLKANPFFADKGFQAGYAAAVPRPVAPNYQEISDIIQIEISKAISKERTPKQAVEEMEKQIKAKLVK
ncbi:ABC transporter substrate-binding protein [Terrilactibacillus laevilacticus]|uniref:ABC transporter substrate-binding protein n=1 Tax=Terrilactibacillus laevilacticus TaxID=1380157 RepID=A0ABW5PL43_9BACI|nr:ABC transporter substrate-binding protein [Terrilactibacillus laevilacticus]